MMGIMKRESRKYLIGFVTGICMVGLLLSILDIMLYQNQHRAMLPKHDRIHDRLPDPNAEKLKRLPDVIMIGSKKCGTGLFMQFIGMHPDVCSTPGEVHYFDWNYNESLEWYRSRQIPCLPNQISIEKSPKYFVQPNVPERIYRMNKTIKLFLIVRDPTVRLISDFVHETVIGNTKKTFEDVVPDNITGGLNVFYTPVETSIYVKHLKNYLKHFSLSQIHIIDGDSFAKNPLPELKKAEKFLSIRSYLNKSHFVYSEEKGFYCKSFQGKPLCAGKSKGRPHPKISVAIIKRCQAFYKIYNEEFFKLVHQRFNWA